jgi:hypothetical protein
MALTIIRASERTYLAEVTPPHSGTTWKTPAPMGLRQLIAELEQRGCHQQDIGDLLYEIDPDWLTRLD